MPEIRIVHGYDVHRFAENRRLVLCGTEIPFEKGLLGHSDADAAFHALSDALLGAAALGDIGKHFPDTDERYKNADSGRILCEVVRKVREKGFVMLNADITIIAEKPKLAGYISEMRRNTAVFCGVATDGISVKATTEEGLGLGESGIGSHAVVLVKKI
jgi:2-C-methyl-D-erythritol 2,4-cyclodiphosphate synthase